MKRGILASAFQCLNSYQEHAELLSVSVRWETRGNQLNL